VRDDVVQLARDPRPLGLDGLDLDPLALDLQLLGAGGQLVDAMAPPAQRLAERPRADVDDHDEDELAAVLAQGDHRQRVGGDDDRRRQPRPSRRQLVAGGEAREGDGEDQGLVGPRALDLAVHEHHRDRDREHGERGAPAPSQRHREAQDEQPVDPARHADRLEHGLELGGDQQRSREQDVEERRGQARRPCLHPPTLAAADRLGNRPPGR